MKKREQRPLLDELDRRIVGLLADDPQLTNKALARRLGLAESTCAYRLRALRERGVVAGTTLRLDYSALGHPLQALIKVRLERHNAEHVNRLYASLVRTPGVIQVFHVAGADDFYLHVAVADAEALRDFVLQHVTVHRVVRQTETHLIFERRDGVGVLPAPEATA